MKMIFFFSSLFLLTSCQPSTAQTQVPVRQDVNVAEFKQLMKQSGTVLIDVRTPQEIAQGKIEGALEINFLDDNFQEKIQELDKSTPYLIYCRSGNRSSKATAIMEAQGFEKLYNLQGGYQAWSQAKN